MKLPEISAWQKPSIIVVIFFIIILAVPFGIIWPSIKEIRNIATSIYHEYDFLEAKRQRGYDIKKATVEYKKALPYLEQIQSLIVREGDELELITSIEELAEKNNVEITLRLSLDSMKDGPRYKKLPINILVSGDYINVLRYITELKTLPMATSFSKISLSKPQKKRSVVSASTEKIEANLTGFVFWKNKPISNK